LAESGSGGAGAAADLSRTSPGTSTDGSMSGGPG